MNHLVYITFTLGLFFQGVSQTTVSTADKAKRVVRLLEERHLQPAALNDSLAWRIHENLMEYLDPSKMLFTAEQLNALEQEIPGLDEALREGTNTYYALLKTFLDERMEVLKNEVPELLKEYKSTLAINRSEQFLREIPTQASYRNKWKSVLFAEVNDRVLDALDGAEGEQKPTTELIEESKRAVAQSYQDYLENVHSDTDFLETAYLNAIAMAFDPHSNYFSAEMNREFSEELTSEREVYGISYSKSNEGQIEISRVLPGSAAWMSDAIHQGDRLLKIAFGEGTLTDVSGMTEYQLSQLFSASNEKTITLILEDANGDQQTVHLQKSPVYSDEDVIKSALLKGERTVGYISLPDFYMNWTDTTALGCANDVAKALIKLKREGIEGLVLDLRDNGGGSLKEAIDLAGIFIDFGPVLIEKDSDGEVYSLKDFNRGAIYTGPLVVLVNSNSASASEVVAGALQDYNRALIVGQPSFGKATGQYVMPIDPLAEVMGGIMQPNNEWGFLKITDIGLYRVDLSTNQGRGVLPDVELSRPTVFQSAFEKDLPNVLDLEAIDKKVFYTPLPALPIQHLNEKSKLRSETSEDIQTITQLFEQFESMNEDRMNRPMNLEELVKLERTEREVVDSIRALYRATSDDFEPLSLNYDSDIYAVSPFMKEYRDRFLKNVSEDRELEETYHILVDWIKFNSK